MNTMLPYAEARQKVIEVAGALRRQPRRESIEIEQAFGRVLASEVRADRDYPPFNRSTRDGFAVRAAIDRAVQSGDHIVPRGSEARVGALLVAPNTRVGYAEMALAAQVGTTRLEVFARPRLAILSTGDEVVDARTTPGPVQVRNSNGISIEVLARTAGAEPIQLGNAPDEKIALRRGIERGLEADILVLSGGVSMGKYDLVEQVLSDLGAEFQFTGVAIRPGRPAVFATCRGKLVFGLPGNPVSTMVTFELFVLPAIDLLSGAAPRPLPLFRAKLATPVHEKGPIVHFLPARIEWEGPEAQVAQLPWQGSGDIVALALANGFLVVAPERPDIAPGEWVDVLPRRGAI
jgi:molybdopterin molybdotransferase